MGVTNYDIVQASAFLGPVINSNGTVYFVDSVNGSDTYDGKGWATALATIDAAIGKCVANKGNTILVAPNHAETLTTAGAITCDIAGITIFGCGVGSNRPRITFGTSTAASILITGASTKILNIIGIAGIDGLTNPIHVQAADCEIDIEWRDGSATVEAARAVLTTAAADRFKLKLDYLGFITGNAVVNAVRLVGCNDGEINVKFYGVASTSIVEFHTTACTNIKVNGTFYNSGTTDLSKNVVDTVTGSTWSVEGFDAAAGCSFSGGSGAAVAKDDLSVVAANTLLIKTETDKIPATITKIDGEVIKTAAIQANLGNPSARTNLQTIEAMLGNPDTASQSLWDLLAGAGGIASFPSGAAPANNVSLAEVIRFIYDGLFGTVGLATFPTAAVAANDVSLAEVLRATQEAVINGTGAAMPTNQSLYDLLAGTNGILTFPASAAPANNVSLAEVLRDIWDSLRNGTGGSEPRTNKSLLDEIKGSGGLDHNAANYIEVIADMTSATWNTQAVHEIFIVTGVVRIKLIAECTGTLTDTGNLGTIQLGVEGATDAFIAATDTDDIADDDIWCDATPTEVYGDTSSLVLDKIINGGKDIGYEIGGEALTGGSITFRCWWWPLSSNGLVTVGAGGTL